MERISAFMDGESRAAETRQAIGRLEDDAKSKDMWATYHLIGDVMRGEGVMHDDFLNRFHQRMETEPTQLAPRRFAWRKYKEIGLAAAASLAAVAISVPIAMTLMKGQPQEIAQAPAPQPHGQRPRPAPSVAQAQGKVNEYLMAHQEFSPRTALQGVVPYVRSVSEPHDGNRR
mgnify:CR=1 FL=1